MYKKILDYVIREYKDFEIEIFEMPAKINGQMGTLSISNSSGVIYCKWSREFDETMKNYWGLDVIYSEVLLTFLKFELMKASKFLEDDDVYRYDMNNDTYDYLTSNIRETFDNVDHKKLLKMMTLIMNRGVSDD